MRKILLPPLAIAFALSSLLAFSGNKESDPDPVIYDPDYCEGLQEGLYRHDFSSHTSARVEKAKNEHGTVDIIMTYPVYVWEGSGKRKGQIVGYKLVPDERVDVEYVNLPRTRLEFHPECLLGFEVCPPHRPVYRGHYREVHDGYDRHAVKTRRPTYKRVPVYAKSSRCRALQFLRRVVVNEFSSIEEFYEGLAEVPYLDVNAEKHRLVPSSDIPTPGHLQP